jgi:hypothetical protein
MIEIENPGGTVRVIFTEPAQCENGEAWRKVIARAEDGERVIELLPRSGEGFSASDDPECWSPDGRFVMVYRVAANGTEALEFLDTSEKCWTLFKCGSVYAGVDNCLGWHPLLPHTLVIRNRNRELEAVPEFEGAKDGGIRKKAMDSPQSARPRNR